LASDDPKTRANAAGALGNFARNSNDLCSELTSAGAVEGLARIVTDHARRLKEGASEGESQKKRSGSREAAPTREESSPVKIALFSSETYAPTLCAESAFGSILTSLT
jgi:hypothetical protein